jgi:hypothetical protein
MGKHIIIVGGVSVNDTGGHDDYPYNFINPAVFRAKLFKTDVTILVFAPPYRKRVTDQKKEHPQVAYSWAYECHLPFVSTATCPDLFKSKKKNLDHFLDVLKTAAKKYGATVKLLETKDDLTNQLIALKPIETVDYFGHSSRTGMFLQYSTTGSALPVGEVIWTAADAAKVTAGAVTGSFTSFGCNQGESGGLAEQLAKLWKVKAVGSDGKTDYITIGQGLPQPKSDNGYYSFPPGGAVRSPVAGTP